MAMISPAQGGGVSVDLDVKGLPAGDMSNFTVAANGTARTTLTNKGNAGDRIACGVITK